MARFPSMAGDSRAKESEPCGPRVLKPKRKGIGRPIFPSPSGRKGGKRKERGGRACCGLGFLGGGGPFGCRPIPFSVLDRPLFFCCPRRYINTSFRGAPPLFARSIPPPNWAGLGLSRETFFVGCKRWWAAFKGRAHTASLPPLAGPGEWRRGGGVACVSFPLFSFPVPCLAAVEEGGLRLWTCPPCCLAGCRGLGLGVAFLLLSRQKFDVRRNVRLDRRPA